MTNLADKMIIQAGSLVCDFVPGQSGGPLFKIVNNIPYIKGVVSHHVCSKMCSTPNTCCGTGYNAFTQFDAELLRYILQWRKV